MILINAIVAIHGSIFNDTIHCNSGTCKRFLRMSPDEALSCFNYSVDFQVVFRTWDDTKSIDHYDVYE